MLQHEVRLRPELEQPREGKGRERSCGALLKRKHGRERETATPLLLHRWLAEAAEGGPASDACLVAAPEPSERAYSSGRARRGSSAAGGRGTCTVSCAERGPNSRGRRGAAKGAAPFIVRE